MTAQRAYANLTQGILDNDGVECEQFPEAFFAIEEVHSNRSRLLEIRFAKGICSTCPVKDLCLTYALEAKEESGIWGGMTAKERHELRSGVIQIG